MSLDEVGLFVGAVAFDGDDLLASAKFVGEVGGVEGSTGGVNWFQVDRFPVQVNCEGVGSSETDKDIVVGLVE